MAAVVRMRYAINFALACEATGYDPTKLLRDLEIDDRLLNDPEAMISEHQLWTFAELAANASGKFDIGFEAGRISSLQDHGPLHLLFQEKTLFERMVTFCELAKLEYSRADFFVQPKWNGLVFGRRRISGSRQQVRQVELYVLQLMLETIRSVLGPSWSPSSLRLQSDYHTSLDTIIGSDRTTVSFSQPQTEIMIRRSDTVTGTTAVAAPASGPLPRTEHTVAALVQTYLLDPRLSLSFIARLLDVGERHLQRQLQREGTNFSLILSRERTKAAVELLGTTDASLAEISRRLGYSNQAHLTRAFQRVVGITPSQFRKSNPRG